MIRIRSGARFSYAPEDELPHVRVWHSQGILHAFRDAEAVADAVHNWFTSGRPLEAGLEEYEGQRTAARMPIFEFTCQLAALEPPPDDTSAQWLSGMR